MFLGRVLQTLVLERLKGADDSETGVARLDDIVDVAILGSHVRVGEHLAITEIACDGIFVAVGAIPQTAWLKDSPVELDAAGLVKVNYKQCTNIDGIFAAGDCTEPEFRQASIAAGTGAKAGISAAAFVNLHK